MVWLGEATFESEQVFELWNDLGSWFLPVSLDPQFTTQFMEDRAHGEIKLPKDVVARLPQDLLQRVNRRELNLQVSVTKTEL